MRIVRPCRIFLSTLALAMLATVTDFRALHAQTRPSEFTLGNGMRVVVVPDTRAPVVTHMVWYLVGAADEPPGTSGIAHFLEHLMFKSTEKIPMGEFSKIVSRLGGQDNAFTSHDSTAYFQRIAKDRLRQVMEMEADRMVNLRLTEKEVLTEREVILEERRSRIENSPTAILDEQMDAALYYSHPYGTPIIGWEHEMAQLSQEDAMGFYKRFYAPNNAILVVAGDVAPDEVRLLAEETYGKVPANPAAGAARERPQEPVHRAARRLALVDARAGNASIHRYYYAPAYAKADPGEAEALEVLMQITASGPTSRLYRKLVVEKKLASSAGGWYSGSGLDSGKAGFYTVVADGASLDAVEAAIDEVVREVRETGVTDAELDRAKKHLVAEFIYESDNQSSLARRYGWGLTVGRTLAEIDDWPGAISKVSRESVKAAAGKYLELRHSVTGTLVPEPEKAGARVEQPAGSRS